MANRARCPHCGGALLPTLDPATLAVLATCVLCGREAGAPAPRTPARPAPAGYRHAAPRRERPAPAPDRRCSHCGLLPSGQRLTRGRCHACHMHWHRTGVDRPPHLLDPTHRSACRNCGQPSARHRVAYCGACYQYQHTHGRPRPADGALSGTCRHGHPRTAETTYIDPRGQRHCRVCRRPGIWEEPPRGLEQAG